MSYRWAPQLTPFSIGQSLQTPVFAILQLFKIYVKYLEYSSGFALRLAIFLPFPRFLVILLQVWKVPQALHCRHVTYCTELGIEPSQTTYSSIHPRLHHTLPTLLPQTALSTITSFANMPTRSAANSMNTANSNERGTAREVSISERPMNTRRSSGEISIATKTGQSVLRFL